MTEFRRVLFRLVPLLVEAAAIQRELLGDDHVDVSFPLINLGRTFVVLGQPDRAVAPLREALALRRAGYGDAHTRVGTALEALAGAVRATGAIDEAIGLYRESVATHTRALDADNSNVAEVEVPLAETLLDRDGPGDREAARRLVAHARPILAEASPDGSALIDRADAVQRRLGTTD